MARIASILNRAIPFAVVVALWLAVVQVGQVPEVFLPSPASVLASMLSGLADGTLVVDTIVSCARVFGGFAVSLAIALPLGIAIGMHAPTRRSLEPLNDFIRYVPVPAMVPLIILWLGIGNASPIAVIVFGTLPQLIVLISDAISRMPQYVRELCRSLQLDGQQLLTHAVVPYASPQIYDGSRVAIGWSWSYLLVAEIVGATHGLGQAIITAQRFLQTPRVIAAILLVALVGLGIDFTMRQLYGRLFPWVSEIRDSR